MRVGWRTPKSRSLSSSCPLLRLLPQNDLQAMARAHRIGQEREVSREGACHQAFVMVDGVPCAMHVRR